MSILSCFKIELIIYYPLKSSSINHFNKSIFLYFRDIDDIRNTLEFSLYKNGELKNSKINLFHNYLEITDLDSSNY
jgi:hypothetical protein